MNGEASSEVIKLKYAVQLRGERIDGAEDGRPYIGLEHIESGTGHLVSSDKTSEELALAGESLCNVFEPGDVLFGKLRPYLAKTWVADFSGRCTTELLVMTPEDADSSYLKYVFLSHKFLEAVNSSSFGVKMPRADWDSVGNQHIYFPQISSQREISAYLDQETVHLDNLIQAKENMLTLLAEKRQALITQAVTRGLDLTVRLKPSGVDWLGDIPDRWDVIMLKFACSSIKTGGTPSPELLRQESEFMVDWYTPGDFNESLILANSKRRISLQAVEEEGYSLFPTATIMLVGIGATLGKVGVTNKPAYCNQQINALVIRERVNANYLALQLSIITDLMNSLANSATLPILNQQRTGEMKICTPPLDEQQQIVDYIKTELNEIDKFQSAAEKTIALLKERRSALITEAVTGQIDIPVAALAG